MDGSLPDGWTGRQDTKAALNGRPSDPEMIAGTLSRREFILANTTLLAPPLVPEIKLRLAHEAHALWHKTEEELGKIGLPPPFWAFAWAGGQALARHVLDNPEIVAGRTVLDLATGSGVVGIAASLSGAAHVTANDIDPFALEAVAINAAANSVTVDPDSGDCSAARPLKAFEVILAGDIFYDRELAQLMWPRLRLWAQSGVDVLVGDPGRAYFPKERLEQLAEYRVPVTRELEDSELKHTSVWRVMPG